MNKSPDGYSMASGMLTGAYHAHTKSTVLSSLTGKTQEYLPFHDLLTLNF
jgi:hypothetical protein